MNVNKKKRSKYMFLEIQEYKTKIVIEIPCWSKYLI
jgi:hypothetical protein